MSKAMCQTDPPHEFEYPSRRGRPPKFCPDHKPIRDNHPTALSEPSLANHPRSVSEPSDVSHPRFLSEPSNENHPTSLSEPHQLSHTSSPSEPKVPNHPGTPSDNPFIKKHNRDRMAKAREAKQAKIEARRAEEEATLEKEFLAIDEREADAYKRYDEAFKAAVTSDDDKLWRRAHEAQQAAINVSKRRRTLYEHFDKETATQAESPSTQERATSQDSPDALERATLAESSVGEERAIRPESSTQVERANEVETTEEPSVDILEEFIAALEE